MADNASDTTRETELREGLIHCREFLRTHGGPRRGEPDSAGDLHSRLFGHRLAFGCCSDLSSEELEEVARSHAELRAS
jgi:hypothetical protein